MDKKKIGIGLVLVIVVIGIAGAVTGNGNGNGNGNGEEQIDYAYTRDSEAYVNVHYTDDIDADNVMLSSMAFDEFIEKTSLADVDLFGDIIIDVYIHEEAGTTILKIETGFGSEQEITSRAESLHKEIVDAQKEYFGEDLEMQLLTPGEEIIRTYS